MTNGEHVTDVGSANSFVDGDFSRDLRGVRLSLRLRGEIDLRGAQLLVLVQSILPSTTVGLVLTGQPIPIAAEWSETSVLLTTDARDWTCLGARHDLAGFYGCAEPAEVLRDVNVDLMLILFPLRIVPSEPVPDIHLGRPHFRQTNPRLRTGTRPPDPGYEVEFAYLPEGWVEIDTIRMDYPTRVAD